MSELFPGFTCPHPIAAGREDRCCLFSFTWKCPERMKWERDLVARAIDGTQQRQRFKDRRVIELVLDILPDNDYMVGNAQAVLGTITGAAESLSVARLVSVTMTDRPEPPPK